MIITASEVSVLLLQNSSVSTQILSMVQLMRAIFLNFFLADGVFGHIGAIALVLHVVSVREVQKT